MKSAIMDTANNIGVHNLNDIASRVRLEKGKAYKDLSTIVVIPTRGMVHMNVVMAWRNLIQPMNQKIFWWPFVGMEVGEAYNAAVENIIANPELSKWRYMLTLEEDNLPPPDGLLKLYESMDKFDVVGGLYWTKGEGGQPMIYGDPDEMPLNFRPQIPKPDTVQRCNGLGMGFTLFKIKIFKDVRLPRPLFRTVQEYDPTTGTKIYTQDLWFFQQAGAFYKFAADTRVKVGHMDIDTGMVW